MEQEIIARAAELQSTGQQGIIAHRQHRGQQGLAYWVQDDLIATAHAWINSIANLIRLSTPSNSSYRDEVQKILDHEQLKGGIPWTLILRMQGVVLSFKDELLRGLIHKLEYTVIATTLDDFLDHAAMFHKANKAREAGVMAAIVLEDTLKKIATKNEIDPKGQSLEELIDALVKANVLTLVKAKRVKAYAGVRNPALHAEWDQFDIRDAGELIAGTRELIEHFL